MIVYFAEFILERVSVPSERFVPLFLWKLHWLRLWHFLRFEQRSFASLSFDDLCLLTVDIERVPFVEIHVHKHARDCYGVL